MTDSSSRAAHVSSAAALGALRPLLRTARHRMLVWLRGTPTWTRMRAAAFVDDTDAALWVGGTAPAGMNALAMRKAATRLGGEHDLVIFDAHDDTANDARRGGFDPDAFGALSGTVRAGGLLVVLTDDTFGTRPDGDYMRLADWPHDPDHLGARYLARLARRLAADTAVVRWREGEPHPYLPPLPPVPASLPVCQAGEVADPDCLSADQARVVERLCALRRRRPLVITADRGRGKSAALGIAAARRLATGERELLVTAPRPGAVAPLFERLAALYPEGERDGALFRWQAPEGDWRQVRFVAPDALLPDDDPDGGEGGPGTTLFVDEAAALPAPLLARWLAAFPRIAFATTVHGYEGTGRGFAVRFRQRLDALTPEWRAVRLETPVRWAPHDPLEALTRDLLCLDAEPASDEAAGAAVARHGVTLRRVCRDALWQDEAALDALFGLLVQAHYRTAPADLRLLLDGPGIAIEVLEAGGTLLGVAVTVDEGGFDAALAEAIARGERRPRGHLMAQSLAVHGGAVEAAQARLRRVMRIAVHPACRRRGLGQCLLAAVAANAADDGIDLLGASFGAERGLIDFWAHAGYVPVRMGLGVEASSGEQTLMMTQAVSAHGEKLHAQLSGAFVQALPALLAFELRTLDTALAARLLRFVPAGALTQDEHERLERYLHGRAPLMPYRTLLQRHALGQAATLPADTVAILVGVLFQGRDLRWVAARRELPGKAQADAWLRSVLAE